MFIDLYRSAVILLMLEGHFIRTVLKTELQQTPIYQFHDFFHGLSAPAFLFGAGLTFVISTRRRWTLYHHWDPPLARRVQRLLFILLLALVLHLPYLSFRRILIDGTTADYLQLFQCDVLNCIGVGLLLLHTLVFFFKTEARFYGLVLTTTAIVCFLTPLMWDINFLNTLPAAIAQLLNGQHGSPFPLFPYVGFLFAGVIVSWEFLIAAERHEERAFMRRMILLGSIFIGGGLLFDALPVQIYPTYDFWFTSPDYFFIRVGCLMILLALFWHFANVLKQPVASLTVFGRESLFVYVLHLIIIYGSAMNPVENLRSQIGFSLGLFESAVWFIPFAIFMLLLALGWNYLKEKQHNTYRLVQLTGSGVFLYYFFRQDY